MNYTEEGRTVTRSEYAMRGCCGGIFGAGTGLFVALEFVNEPWQFWLVFGGWIGVCVLLGAWQGDRFYYALNRWIT